MNTANHRSDLRTGPVTRYFLRRMAQALREGRNAPASLAYTRALAEVMVVFVLMPGIAVFSIAAWFCTKAPVDVLPSPQRELPLAAATLVTFALVLAGHLAAGHRVRRFRADTRAAAEFDTDRDRQIAFWQKFLVTAICGIAAPLCTLLTLIDPSQ